MKSKYSVDHQYKWSYEATTPVKKYTANQVVMDIAQLYKIGGIKVIRSTIVGATSTSLLLTHSGFAIRVDHKIFSGINCFSTARETKPDTANNFQAIINYYEALAFQYIANGIIRV